MDHNIEPRPAIASRNFWFKVVDFLQQNWALIEPAQNGVIVHFLNDEGGVFDELPFTDEPAAEQALTRNGFQKFADDEDSQRFIRAPSEPFRRRPHPNGNIYSSGRFWH